MEVWSQVSWSRFAIPDSTPEIELARLRTEADGAFTVLVRFPPGWERPVTGSYDAAEEALVLDGALTMSGREHVPGDFARWGVDYERAGTSTPHGATVLAWFSGPNRWTAGSTGRTRPEASVAWRDAPTQDLGALGTAHVLSEHPEVSVVLWPHGPVAAPAPIGVDLFACEQGRFVHVPAGQPLPDLDGPVLGRLRGGLHRLT